MITTAVLSILLLKTFPTRTLRFPRSDVVPVVSVPPTISSIGSLRRTGLMARFEFPDHCLEPRHVAPQVPDLDGIVELPHRIPESQVEQFLVPGLDPGPEL